MKRLRAVFDVTVFLDALLRPDGESAALLRRLVSERDFELVLSPTILTELERALADPGVEELLAAPPEELRRWVASLGVVATTVRDGSAESGYEDTKDDEKYLAAARQSDASLVVTLDPELLASATRSDANVVEPERLLELLEARRLGSVG